MRQTLLELTPSLNSQPPPLFFTLRCSPHPVHITEGNSKGKKQLSESPLHVLQME